MSLFKKFKKEKDYLEPWEKSRTKNGKNEFYSGGELEAPQQFFPEEAYAYDNPYSEYYHKQPVASTNQATELGGKNDNKVNPNVPANQPNVPVTSQVPPNNGGKPYVVPNNGVYPYQATGKAGKEPYVYKPRIAEKKLIILLIEDTVKMSKENESIVKLSKICNGTDWVYVIHYGKEVKVKKIELKKFFKKDDEIKPDDLKCSEDATEDVCLWDALTEVNKIVSDLYGKVKEIDKVTTKVTNIEIIGIGTSKDNCSKTSEEDGITSFCKTLKDNRIKSKYFCLNESCFLSAAKTGFRSIGSISKDYYQHETE